MKIKKETSNAMLMWVTFLLIERGIIAEQTEKKHLAMILKTVAVIFQDYLP